jgi:hypothetical protein
MNLIQSELGISQSFSHFGILFTWRTMIHVQYYPDYCLPDDGDKLRHAKLLWYEEFGLVQIWQRFFFVIPFHDHLEADTKGTSLLQSDPVIGLKDTDRNLCGKLGPDPSDLLSSCRYPIPGRRIQVKSWPRLANKLCECSPKLFRCLNGS